VRETETRNAAAQAEFYKAWPSLKGYDKQVLQVGALFRQLNPNATPQEAIERIGKVVHEALGIAIPAPGAAAPASPAVPAAPAKPAAPFRPAGGSGASPAPAPSGNEFEAMAEAMLTGELDGD
jgi:hypothetical protein